MKIKVKDNNDGTYEIEHELLDQLISLAVLAKCATEVLERYPTIYKLVEELYEGSEIEMIEPNNKGGH